MCQAAWVRLKHLKDIKALKRSLLQHQEVEIQVKNLFIVYVHVAGNIVCYASKSFFLSTVSRKRADAKETGNVNGHIHVITLPALRPPNEMT